MAGLRLNKYPEQLASLFLLISIFIYQAFLNRYHILYLEQSQLFLFTTEYFKELMSMPGGFAQYAGNFFTQFFINPWTGALIHVLYAISVYRISSFILKKLEFGATILSFVPVWLLTILQSSELFNFGQSTGFLILLSFYSLYLSVRRDSSRLIFFFAGWPLLYFAAGGFAVPAAIMCALHELLYVKSKFKVPAFSGYLITMAVLPYLSGKLIYYIDPRNVYTWPLTLDLHGIYRLSMILLLLLLPLLQLTIYFTGKSNMMKPGILRKTNLKKVIFLFLLPVMVLTVLYSRNRQSELMLGMDHHFQKHEWEKVLNLSKKYPGYNRLVMYFTNTALYKTGKLGDRMFSYPQAGAQGLRLKWERNSSSFFGGDIFYELGYINESERWAFEAMIVKGLNPRSLKRLVLTSILKGDTLLAEKYLNKLDKTIFYSSWSKNLHLCITGAGPREIKNELALKRNPAIKDDFFSNENNLNLSDLLDNNPGNRMAYEYMLASLLLEKDLKDFAGFIGLIKNYGYERIPVHFEEALVFYNFSEGINAIPAGYSISSETKDRFKAYLGIYTSGEKNIVSNLKKNFGDTFWYYIQFTNPSQYAR
jgi:hypothetical protein